MTQSAPSVTTAERRKPRAESGLFAIAFTLSGFASLAYQIAWQRVMTQVIGADAISVVFIVAIFMISLGLGAEIGRRILHRIGSRAGEAYAVLEAAVGVMGIVSIPVLRAANAWFATTGIDSVFADFILNLLLLAPPVIGMGMTTPLIVEIAKHELADLGRTVGRLYGLNILGAAIGALLTGLILIELLGLKGVTIMAGVINITIGIVVLTALRRNSGSARNAIVEAREKPATRNREFALSHKAAAVLFGFGTLALQIIFFRVLCNYFTMSTIVFPIVLCVYLLLMSAGQSVGGSIADRFSNQLPGAIAAVFAIGSLLTVLALRFPPEWAARLGALSFTGFSGQLVEADFPHLIGDPSPLLVFAFSLCFMAAVLAWAALFPMMIRLVTRNIAEAGEQFAVLYSLYTVGNVVGAFVCGIVFFEHIGTGGTAIATILICGAGALFAAWPTLRLGLRSGHLAWLSLALGCLAAAIVPLDYYKSFKLGKYMISEVYEGRTGVASVVPTSRFYTIIDMNRTASASALSHPPGPDDSYEGWRWNHSELCALDPAFRPKHVLIIGIGHAYLMDAMLDLPFVEKITVVDLSQEIVDAVRDHSRTSTKRIFADPRVEIIVADGRRFIQKALAHGVRYDLVQIKINEPWHAGSGNLFTVEFFKSLRQLLKPDGYLGLRPVLGHIVDGLQVFDEIVWPGYYHMFFKNGKFTLPRSARVTPDIKNAWFNVVPGQPVAAGTRAPVLNLVTFTAPPPAAKGVVFNTDDRPTFEYCWLRKAMGTWVSPIPNLWDLKLEARAVPVVVE